MANFFTRLHFFQALCGDCIGITFREAGKKNRHFIIDAGYPGTYRRTLRPFALEINEKNEKIDLFIITHIDNDHIGGIKPFLKEFGNTGLVKHFWFNWSQYRYPIVENDDDKISISQGVDLREYLKGKQLLESVPITTKTQFSLGGANLTVLSPNGKKFERFQKNWGQKERKILERLSGIKVSAERHDYSLPVSDLARKPFKEDDGTENGSSIAFLFEFGSLSGLFLSDAIPSVVVQALRVLGYSKRNPLRVDFVKLSHHGSRGNTSHELIQLIDCSTFIICANGKNAYNLPHKETLARIADHHVRKNPGIFVNFLFNYDNQVLRAIFSEEEKREYLIRCDFPTPGKSAFVLEFG